MRRINLYSIILFTTFIIYSCENRGVYPDEVSSNVVGKYTFKYPSGQVEVVTINSDSTYKQAIYLNQENYSNTDSSLYDNSGTWFVLGKKMNFDNWLMYNHLRYPDSILVSPYETTLSDVYWYDGNKNQKPSLLSVFSETGYVFKKVN